MGAKRLKNRKIAFLRAAIVFASIMFALAVIASFFLISDVIAHGDVRAIPSYAMDEEGLDEVLSRDKDSWTDGDYDFVYRQTGLTKVYFDGVSYINTNFVKQCQADLFYDAEPEHDAANFGSSHDYFPDKLFSMVSLRAGDVIISSSVHTFGWLNGHAAIVINSTTTLQAITIGTKSVLQTTNWFRHASNFMVLRPKLSADEAQQIAQWAHDNMQGIDYSLFTGIFNAKNQADEPLTTQCAHLVWQAYMAFGYDIDSTGGPVVTPRNIAASDMFEVVQVNGFDLDKLWN